MKPTQIAKAKFARATLLFVNMMLRAAAWCLWPRRRPAAPSRVSIYRVGTIGDMMCALPALYSIRRHWPEAHLTLVTSPGSRGAPEVRDLIEGLGWFDEIITYYNEDLRGLGRQLEFARGLRRRAFSAWIEFPGVLYASRHIGLLLRNMIIARFAARWGRGWQIGTVSIFRQAQSDVLEFSDETDRLLASVKRMGIEPVMPPTPLPISDSTRQTAEKLLDSFDSGGRSLVGIAPGAKRSTNRWPTSRFSEVARHLGQAGYGLVLFGGQGDAQMCTLIAEAAGGNAINLAGRCSVAESCAVLARCDLLICNDSGVQHLAAAMGTPCLSLFAARDFDLRWRPHGPDHTAIRKWVPCHTCFLEECPYDNHCLKLISAEEVVTLVLNKFSQWRNE